MPERPPNLLIIVTDQQSATMMSCAGNPCLHTPAMDSLAAEGVRFSQAFCTNPVCVPSRFSLFTGHHGGAIGLRSDSLPDGIEVPPHIRAGGMGHLLRQAGYEVLYGGKEGLPMMRMADLGFDNFCRDERDALAEECASRLLARAGAQHPPFLMVASFITPHDICYMAIEHAPGSDAAILQHGKRDMAEMKAAQALPPGMTQEEFWGEHCPPLPPNHLPQDDEPEAIQHLIARRPFRRAVREGWSEQEWRLHRWTYHRLTERVDGQLGIVLAALRESGLADNTIVIFTSDHGDHDAAHKLEHKTAMYEEAMRVPLIIRDPRCALPGTVSDALACSGTDLMATVCDYAGVQLPESVTGRSLAPLARGESPSAWRDHLLVESEIGYGIRTPGYFYAIHDSGRHREQLYDLRQDPGQTRNYAQNPALAKILTRHRQLARAYAHVAPQVPADCHCQP